MEIADYLVNEANMVLMRAKGKLTEATQLLDTKYYVAESDDKMVWAFGVVDFMGKQYKIGTKLG